MAQTVKVCELDPDLKEKLRKFRFRKETNNAAIVMKIDRTRLTIVLDEEHQDLTIEELAEELHSSQPRFMVYSYCYKHDDGRISYPLCFIFCSPQGSPPELQMMYAGSMTNLVQEIEVTKVFEVRSTEDLTEEWLLQKLAFFR